MIIKRAVSMAILGGIVSLSSSSLAAPLTNAVADFAFIKGGSGTPEGNTGDNLKNATGGYMKIAMYKLSTSNIVGACTSATFGFVTKNDTACNLLVWGVKDTGATGWDWTGGTTGDVTWNSVIANGLFTPADNYATSYTNDPNVVLLATIPVDGTGNPYDLVSEVSGSGLTDLLNADSDGMVTLVVTIDANANLYVRNPITYTPSGYLITESDPSTFTLAYGADQLFGSISGTTPQTVASGGSGTAVTAVDTNFPFASWSDGVTDNPRTDTGVSANVRVYANYVITTETLIYEAGENGTISGVATQTVNTGSGGSAVEAVPDTNYQFVVWSDGISYNPRTDVNVTNDINVTATFAPMVTDSAPIVDQGQIVGGASADAFAGDTGDIALKSGGGDGDYTRIAMLKADLSAVDAVEAAHLSFLIKDNFVGDVLVWGVKDSAANGWDWDSTTNLTWNNVLSEGMFTPMPYVSDIIGDTNLVLLGTFTFTLGSGANTPFAVANSAPLDSLINADTDDMLTFVVAVNADNLVNATLRNPLVNTALTFTDETVTYAKWAELSGLTVGVNDGLTDDVEPGGPDGMDNLFEYGVGGDPLADDSAVYLPVEFSTPGYLNLVYRRRTDAGARGLTYEVLSSTDLVTDPIDNATDFVGAGPLVPSVPGFESVTNRVPTAVEDAQFMQLKITINE